MRTKTVILLLCAFLASSLLLGIGYATLNDTLTVSGQGDLSAVSPGIHIIAVAPQKSAGVEVFGTSGSVMSARVEGSGTARFSVTVTNTAESTYVFERIIDGAEMNVEGVYNGTMITYEMKNVVSLTEIAPSGGLLTFDVAITVPSGVTAENYVLKFNFLEKQSSEILPDTPDPPSEPDDPDQPAPPTPDEPENPDGDSVLHGDFRGLVEAILSEEGNSLNGSSLIYNAVISTLTSGKRPPEDPPILHCTVNSVSGGTMSDIMMSINQKLTQNLHFIFEADPVDKNRLFLYMYYEEDIEKASSGDRILVYRQVVVRGSDGVWVEDGTYIGHSVVGYYFGGGNNGKDVFTINAYEWKAGDMPQG